jgi:hypothetical protein
MNIVSDRRGLMEMAVEIAAVCATCVRWCSHE